ncbi:MAG: AAA family ATPase [Proteobacteria bacterium]|nr:AAA family ATPase [Pseudomonadota bacterium]
MQIPPSDEAAERALLGSALLDNSCLPCIQAISTSSDFYNDRHRIIFECMLALRERSIPIDAVTLGREIERRGEMKRIGGAMAISGLTDVVATIANVEHYAEIVRDLSQRREMIAVSREIIDAGHRQEIDTSDYLSASRSKVLAIVDHMSERFDAIPVRETIGDAYEEALKQARPERLVETGIGPIDRQFGGLWPQLLSVVASRPSIGKSCLAVNIATNAALAGKKVLIVSLEDPRRFVEWRILARLGHVALDRIVQRSLSKQDKDKLTGAKEIVSGLSLWIKDTGVMTSEQIRRLAFSHVDKLDLDLIVIDHLGHIRDNGNNLYEATSKAVRTIANIPKEINIPVLLLHQLNRAVEYRDTKEPKIADLRQSGEVEQLARVVWLLHRPAYYYPEREDPNEMALIVAKNSHGKTGKVKLSIDLPHMDVARESKINQMENY